jgi:twitching motility protein PilJ
MKVLTKKMGGFLKPKTASTPSKPLSFKFPGFGKKDALDVDTALIDPPTGAAPTTAMESLAAHTLVGQYENGPALKKTGKKYKASSKGFLAKMPLEKQQKIFVTALAFTFSLTLLFVWLDIRHSRTMAEFNQSVTEIVLNTQRLAKSIPAAMKGDATAFPLIEDSRNKIATLDAALAANSVVLHNPELLGKLQFAEEKWKPTAQAAQNISGAKKFLQDMGAVKKRLVESSPLQYDEAKVIAVISLQSGSNAKESALASELVGTSQILAKEIAEAFTEEGASQRDPAALMELYNEYRGSISSLLNGDARAGIEAAKFAEVKRALTSLKTQVDKVETDIAFFVKGLPRLRDLRKSEQVIGKDSETIRDVFQEVATASMRTGASWDSYTVVFFGVLSLIAAGLWSRNYMKSSELRASEAELQKEQAESLERDAKRTNDQNQAAILRLMNELQEVADGDLTVQATVSEDITGAIADSVNYTVDELRSLVARINKTAAMVNEASSSAQLTATSLQAATEQQFREIRETGEAVLRMAQQINEVSSRASESVTVARQSKEASEAGQKAVSNAIVGMNGIRDQIQDTSKRIKRLGESSQEIGEIVELISDITEQTNVLALNAAIQAASAGEAGRGFTIVAEEVQRLAERSGEATKQISALIKTIQTDTQDAVSAMERSTAGVVEGTKLSDDAGQALGEIGSVSSQLANLIEDFSAVTSKQASSAGTVAQSIQRILLVTEQTSEGTQQTAGSIRQLAELAQELKSSVSRFKVS